MLLAAGLGTRLRPLTDHTPKALVEVGGVPILERVVRRLLEAGVDRLVINLHHLGGQIRDYAAARDGWGIEVLFSDEEDALLETGGGLRRAAPLLRGDAPFFLHNADILTDLPLRDLYEAHLRADPAPLATLAVMERETSRHLLFDDAGLLGRTDTGKGLRLEARAAVGEVRKLAFAGVHVISPALLDRMTETGAFSILDPYLRLVGEGARVAPFRIDAHRWTDIGKPEQLAEAARWIDGGER
jgi:NDP-sugar pyrophosphorylase family protein